MFRYPRWPVSCSHGVKRHARSWIWRSRDDGSHGEYRNGEQEERSGWMVWVLCLEAMM